MITAIRFSLGNLLVNLSQVVNTVAVLYTALVTEMLVASEFVV